MGWTFTHRPKGQSTIEFFNESFDGEAGRVVDAAAPSFTEAYVAYELLDGQGNRRGVIAIVCLTQWRHHDYLNFGYKYLSECCGPCATNCPERILELLTLFDFGSEKANRWSREWRQACWSRVETRLARPSLTRDDLIWFPEPVKFTSEEEHQALQVRSPRRLIFTRPGLNRGRWKIRRRNLDGAKIIASTVPGSKEARHPVLHQLVEVHGPRRVGRAYERLLQEAPVQIWKCTRDPATAGKRMVELMESVIAAAEPEGEAPCQMVAGPDPG